MIGTAAFVIGFLALGVGVLLLAMRGGPRGMREGLHTQSHRSRRFNAVVLPILLIAFGLGLPLWVLVANEEGQAKEGPGGVELSAAQTHGRDLFAKTCAQCHQLGGASAVGRVGPNLDTLRPKAPLTLDAIAKGRARGQGQMPAELLDGEDAKSVASFVEAVAGR